MVEKTQEPRAASPADALAVADIFLSARRAAMPYLPVLHTEAEVLRWIERAVLPVSRVLVADDGARPVGFAAVRGARLDHLYVSPGAQGRGLGGRLLTAAKEASPHRLTLVVFQRNTRARAFYERRGFGLVELRDGSQNEENEPDAVYAWEPRPTWGKG